MDIIKLDDVEASIGFDTSSIAFKEFCSDLDELGCITDSDLYLEKVRSNEQTLRSFGKSVGKNTYSTTLDVAKAYGTVVDSNASLIKSMWDLMMRALQLAVRAISFILRKISYIPYAIIKLGNKVADIPDDVRNKIRGNIKLYITIPDIQNLYNNQLLNKLTTFMGLATRLSQGEMWGTFISRRDADHKILVGENDMKTCKEMQKIYGQIKLLEFNPSTIEMKDKTTVDAYFGTAKSVNFTDLNGKKHNSTYYEALTTLLKDIESQQQNMEKIQKSIGEKYKQTQINTNFSKLHYTQQMLIRDSISMISKLISVIGNIIRYINTDIETLNNATDALLKKAGVKVKETPKKEDKKK